MNKPLYMKSYKLSKLIPNNYPIFDGMPNENVTIAGMFKIEDEYLKFRNKSILVSVHTFQDFLCKYVMLTRVTKRSTENLGHFEAFSGS